MNKTLKEQFFEKCEQETRDDGFKLRSYLEYGNGAEYMELTLDPELIWKFIEESFVEKSEVEKDLARLRSLLLNLSDEYVRTINEMGLFTINVSDLTSEWNTNNTNS
jgi:phosphosulfolactate synthase (CoM biosynthesis protein A)